MEQRDKKALLGKMLIVSAAFAWGLSFVVMKGLVDKVPVFRLLAVRYVLATLVMGVALRGRLARALRDRQTLVMGIVLGILGFLAYAAQTLGLAITTPGRNAFFTGCYCVMVPFISWAFGQGRPLASHLTAAVLCVAGIGLVSAGGAGALNAGDWLTLLGAVCYALQFVVLSKWGEGVDSLSVTAIEFVMMALGSCMTTLATESGLPQPAITVGDVASLAYLVLVCSCFTFVALNWGMMHVPTTEASILSSLEAPFGVGASIVLYHELVTARTFLGFGLIFVAILLSEVGERLFSLFSREAAA